MGTIGSIIGELIMIIAGASSFYVYGGYYKPSFKSDKERERHQELINNKAQIFKIGGVILVCLGLFRLITKIL